MLIIINALIKIKFADDYILTIGIGLVIYVCASKQFLSKKSTISFFLKFFKRIFAVKKKKTIKFIIANIYIYTSRNMRREETRRDDGRCTILFDEPSFNIIKITRVCSPQPIPYQPCDHISYVTIVTVRQQFHRIGDRRRRK